MKNVPKLRSGGKSCSCTTCVYKSESDHPSLRRFIADGSRIDRLYYGKYIPLREKKLLDRLVRTRAVYDDIRARLISDSTVSLSTMGDFRKKTSGEYDTDESSAAILKFVNMVDKGATLGSAKLSDCCTCCSCSSKFNVNKHSFKRHRRQRALVSTYDYLNARNRAGETYHRNKGVRFKAKHTRSDPCTCTFKFSGLLKKQSKTLLKRIHSPLPLPILDLDTTTDREMGPKRGLGDVARTSYQNLKQTNVRLKEKISEGMAKIKESQTRIREKLEVQTKKSLEKLTKTKDTLSSKVKASAQKLRRVKTKTETMCLCPNNEIAFQVKKDSISKFKEDLRRKQIMKDWECEPECIKNTCIPEECFIRLKEKKSNRKNVHHKGIKYQKIMKERKTGDPLDRSDTTIQTENLRVAKIVTTEKNNPLILADRIQAAKQPHLGLDKTSNRKKVKEQKITHMKEKNNICACETLTDTQKKIQVEPSISLTKKSVKNTMHDKKVSHRPKNYKPNKTNVEKNYKDIIRMIKVKESPLYNNTEKQNTKNIKVSSISEKRNIQKSPLERKSSQRQAVRIGSSFSFNIEFYKNKMDPKISLVHLQKTPTDSKQRSGIVYKSKKSNKDKTKKRRLHHKGSQIIFKKTFKDNHTGGYSLRRCFCTLMLKAKTTKSKIRRPITNKVKTSEKSILTLNSSVLTHKMLKLNDIQINTSHKKEMKKKKKKESNLLPYECESGVCVPGNCNPYQCIQLINMRKGKKKTLSACVCPANLSSSRKTKSTSSFTSRSYKPSKTKYVQSMYTYRDHIYSRPAVEKKHIRRTIEKKSDRQAVRVGSTFSFNIEFYKGNGKGMEREYNASPTGLKSLSIKPKQKTYQKVKVKEHGFQENVKYRRNTPTQMHKKERNALIGTTLKRCFCTLKLQKKEILKTPSKKTFTTGTKSVIPSYLQIETANKSTKTKSKYGRKLEPFECAPFTCIPGSCDPYVCWDIIKKRNIRLKEVGFTTKRPETITSSTTYSGKPLKTVQIQYKPKHKQPTARTQKISTISKKYTAKKPAFEYSSSAMSNQVVKIGSTFSFDIEFHKKKAPPKTITNSYPSEKTRKTNTVKILKNKSIKRTQLNVAHVDSQVDGSKKVHKSSVARPLLNRCFCTLNLQKKQKHDFKTKPAPVAKPIFPLERIYTVNRAILPNTQLFTNSKYQINVNKMPLNNSLPKYIDRNLLGEKINSKIHPIYNVTGYRRKLLKLNYKSGEVRGWQPVKTSSNICAMQSVFNVTRQNQKTLNIYPIRNIKEIENFVNEAVDFKNLNGVGTSTSHVQYNQLLEYDNNLNPAYYFGQCFYTMNLKVKNGEILQRPHIKNDTQPTKLKKHALHKLKSYECEPGICIPGECNPYDCQKIISKRLRKNKIKKSGTNYKQSVSSFASEYSPQSKSNKQQTSSLKSRKQTVYKARSKHGDKQAVRIGSSFSFDIHFSKNVSTSQKDVVVPKYSSDTKLAKWTIKKEKKINSHSQSGFLKTKHKRSLTEPIVRRCFCTLKLQKKGRLQKQIQNKQPLTSNEFRKVKTTSTGQNTKKKFKPLNIAHSLKPYECEPNICIPGQCDPYECLEIMKKRTYNKHHHEFGTSALPNNKSISSMTDDQIKKLHRSRAISVNPKNAVNDITVLNNKFDNCVTKTSRNTLKVGSSFSFNVEFFKDCSPVHNYVRKESNAKEESKNEKNRFLKKTAHLPKERYNSDAMREHSSNYRMMRHNRSQITNSARSAGTLTDPAIKRCFCTVPLFNSNNVQNIIQSQANKYSSSVLNKCLCFFKRMKRPKNLDNNKKLRDADTLDKTINTQNVQNIPKLLPYECSRGICVPGECNPYLCEKIMAKRPGKKSFKTSTSGMLNTQSVSSKRPIKIKNVNTYTKQRRNSKSIKKADDPFLNSDKRIVNIGSKFSFDIEFYKKNPKKIKEHESWDSTTLGKVNWIKYNKNKNLRTTKQPTGLVTKSAKVHNTKVRNHATGLNNLIKRCFCTLKITGNNKNNKKKKENNSTKVKTKSVMAKENRIYYSNELKPFECEPNICTPYRCNPYECEKLIKLRHNKQDKREFGIAAIYPRKNSIASITDLNKKPKTKSRAIMKKSITPRKKEKILNNSDTRSIVQSKQCVRLGSSFSFNIEFAKDKRDGVEKFSKNNSSGTNLRKRENYKRKMMTNKTYTSNEKMRTHSTMTKFSPLKRCFCTLSLRKPNKKQRLSANKLKASVSTGTDAYKITKQQKLNLLPYECEPNICFPGECNPIECLDRIKKRYRISTGTAPGYTFKKNVAVSMPTGKHKIKNKKSQLDYSKYPMKSSSYISYVSPKQKFGKGSFKQAVRIGSTFSFDIEFFKNRTSDNTERFKKTPPRQNYKMVKENLNKRKMNENDMRQTNELNKYSNKNLFKNNWSIQNENKVDTKRKGASINPLYKRCFCAFKLHKIGRQRKNLVLLKNKMKKTQTVECDKEKNKKRKLESFECEPNVCIPGKCNPYECEQRIRKRLLKEFGTDTEKSPYISTFSETNKPILKPVKTQTLKISPEHKNIYVKETGAEHDANRQVVRIGSNFSFNVELFKTRGSKDITAFNKDIVKLTNDRKYKIKNLNNAYNAYPKVGVTNFKTCRSQGKKIWTDDKCINAGNALKRCFCTLELQNRNKFKTENIMPFMKRTQYPQNIEVRRVAVQHKSKMLPKYSNIEVKSVGTRINKKYIQTTDCNFCLCQNDKHMFSDDMKTILPYRPRKFNKTFSFTELHLQNFKPLVTKKYKEPQKKITTCDRRLTRKKSKRKIHFNNEPLSRENAIPKVKFQGLKRFFTRCAQILLRKASKYSKNFTFCDSPKNVCEKNCNQQFSVYNSINKPDRQNKIIRDRLKPSKSERPARFNQLISHSQPKKTKSLKFRNIPNDKKCKKTRPNYENQTNKKALYQCGDVKCVSPVMSIKINRKQITKSNMKELLKGENMLAQRTLNLKTKPKTLKPQKISYKNEDLCSHCLTKQEKKKLLITIQGRSTPLKVHFMDVAASKTNLQHKKSYVTKNDDSLKKPIKHDSKSERLVRLCKYCHSCGRQLNKNEFDKAAGDQLLKQSKSRQIISANGKEKIKRMIKNDNVCSGDEAKKPLFELHLDSSSYDILNKDELNYNVSKFNNRSKKKLLRAKHANKIHGKSCQCCICLAKQYKNESKLNIISKATNASGKSVKPCVCGSLVCAKKAQKIANKLSLTKQRYKWKSCVCGSTVCDRESAAMKTISGNIKCICQKEKEKRNKKFNAKKMKKEKKKRSVRLKQQSKDDRKRLKQRRKDHKRLERKINKNASDVALLTDTVIDIGKLGVTACSDILRVVARSAHDPKHACKTLKTIKDNPNLLIKHLKSAYAESGVIATTRRVRLRCLAMRGVKKVKTTLESYAITKYLLNIASKDPKSRIVKPQRVRERFDFGCSLYMGSLRKKPFLAIYDRCPVFYPHCLALVNVWKQFMDISLFLLAVVVWSPCILCMELCRACMCCFFCTG